MLLDILVVAFVGAICAIVLLGHGLLLIAIWPGLLARGRASEGAMPAASPQPASRLGWSGRKVAA